MTIRTVLLGVVAFLGAAPASAQSPAPSVITLGTGTPFPDPHRQGSATAVTVGSMTLLFDAGSGVERQLRAAGLPMNGPTALFVTHLHSDHTLGLADLILTSWVMRRTRPFGIYGPPGTARMVDKLAEAYAEDIQVRTDGLEHEVRDGWKVRVTETRGGVVFDSAGVKVTAIPVPHGNWPVAFGYLVEGSGKRVVLSGDTRYSEALEAAARDADVLVAEVYPSTRMAPEDRPGGADWPEYLRQFHISDEELGRLASRARPKLLVLTHIVRMGATDDEILAGIRRGGFQGPVKFANDLDRF